jgi:PAS domain S-box-containing protein
VDITARKQAQLARSRLAAIVESSSDAIIGSTLDGTITDWNKGAEAMLGYSADEIVGQSISMLYPAARMDELRRIDQQIQRGEVVHPFETLRIRKDRSAINVAITLSPIKEAGENITGISANLRDITERKRLEKEILEVSEREQSRIGQDLHDGLCQQLAGIEFRLLALKQKLESKSKKEIAETKKLAKMVRQGIEQTRTLARGLSPVMLETDGLMNALQELAINTKEMFNISCSFNCPAPLPIHDNAVATHLYRIAQEAVQNAIRHGKAKFVVINLFTQNDRIVLGVKDDGVGFSRKPRNHKGMGLHIMQYRAGMVGGSLAVQREAEGGTSVICSLSAEATQETARSKANEGR